MKTKTYKYLFKIADSIAANSHCLSKKVGCLILRDDKYIVATGYNGPPSKYKHCKGEKCPRQIMGFKSGEGLEFCPAEHAERNAIDTCAKLGISLRDSTLVLNTIIPCRECAKAIVNSGIKKVVALELKVYPEPGLTGEEVLRKCGVEIVDGKA